jgi:hypothetical protein
MYMAQRTAKLREQSMNRVAVQQGERWCKYCKVNHRKNTKCPYQQGAAAHQPDSEQDHGPDKLPGEEGHAEQNKAQHSEAKQKVVKAVDSFLKARGMSISDVLSSPKKDRILSELSSQVNKIAPSNTLGTMNKILKEQGDEASNIPEPPDYLPPGSKGLQFQPQKSKEPLNQAKPKEQAQVPKGSGSYLDQRKKEHGGTWTPEDNDKFIQFLEHGMKLPPNPFDPDRNERFKKTLDEAKEYKRSLEQPATSPLSDTQKSIMDDLQKREKGYGTPATQSPEHQALQSKIDAIESKMENTDPNSPEFGKIDRQRDYLNDQLESLPQQQSSDVPDDDPAEIDDLLQQEETQNQAYDQANKTQQASAELNQMESSSGALPRMLGDVLTAGPDEYAQDGWGQEESSDAYDLINSGFLKEGPNSRLELTDKGKSAFAGSLADQFGNQTGEKLDQYMSPSTLFVLSPTSKPAKWMAENGLISTSSGTVQPTELGKQVMQAFGHDPYQQMETPWAQDKPYNVNDVPDDDPDEMADLLQQEEDQNQAYDQNQQQKPEQEATPKYKGPGSYLASRQAQNDAMNPYDDYSDPDEDFEPVEEPEDYDQVGEGKFASADGLMSYLFSWKGRGLPTKASLQRYIDSRQAGYVVIAVHPDTHRRVATVLIREGHPDSTFSSKQAAVRYALNDAWGMPTPEKGNNPAGMGADYNGTILNKEGQEMDIPQNVPSAGADNSGGEKNAQEQSQPCKYCGSPNTNVYPSGGGVQTRHCNDCSMQWRDDSTTPQPYDQGAAKSARKGKLMSKKQAARIHEGWGDQNEYKRELEADSAEDVWKLHQSLNGQEVTWAQKVPPAVVPQDPAVTPNGDVEMPEAEPDELKAQQQMPAAAPNPGASPMPMQARKRNAQTIDSDFPDGKDDPELKGN